VKRLKIKISVQLLSGEEKNLKRHFKGSIIRVLLDFLVFIAGSYWKDFAARAKKIKKYITPIIPKFLLKKNDPIPVSYQGTILAVLINLGALIWVMNNGIVPVARSEDYPNNNVEVGIQTAGTQELFNSKIEPVAEDALLKKNAYDPLSYSKEQCQRDKKNKMSSDLCGKDQMDPVIPATKKIVIVAHRQPSCKHDDKPRKSKQDKGKHLDEDCCPDPDEWPKPGCIYKPSDYAVMLSGPRK
jgi:hypothetical protein